MNSTQKKSGHAFTLLELLVAVVVGGLLVTLLLSVALSASSLWGKVNGKLSAAASARAVLDQVETDLQGAVFRNDGNVWLAATVLTATTNSGVWVNSTATRPVGDSLILTEQSIEQNRFGVAGVWLRLFTDVGGQNTANLRAVGYQIVRRAQSSSAGAEVSYMLFRSVVSDSNTFAAGYSLDPTSGGYRSASATSGNAGNILRPPLDAVLADHIVDFGVRFFRYDSVELKPLFPAASSDEWSNSELSHLVRLGPLGSTETAKPDVVEVMVRVLTEEGVRLLRNYENPPAGYVRSGTWWEIVERNSHTFTRRIVLSQGAL